MIIGLLNWLDIGLETQYGMEWLFFAELHELILGIEVI